MSESLLAMLAAAGLTHAVGAKRKAAKKKAARAKRWDFRSKFRVWLAFTDTTLNAFSKRKDVKMAQSTLRSYVEESTRIPVDALWTISQATGITMDAWWDPRVGFEEMMAPPSEDARTELRRLYEDFTEEELAAFAAILGDPREARRMLALYRVVQQQQP